MSDEEKLSEVVSVRFTANELAELKQAAGDRPVGRVVRERVVAESPTQKRLRGEAWNPHLVRQRGRDWTLDAAPGRDIGIGRGQDWWRNLVVLRTPADARLLAAALLRAAEIADAPEPVEEVSA